MSKKAIILAQKIMETMNSHIGKQLVNTMNELLNVLEEKNDPDQIEMFIVDNITQYMEKFSLINNNLNGYVVENVKQKTVGELISDHYNTKDYIIEDIF